MENWLDWFRAVYPVLVTLVSLAGLGCVLWLGTKFASKAEFEGAKTKADNRTSALEITRTDHEARIKMLEEAFEASPTRQELHDDIAKLGERMAGMEQGMKGIEKQISTFNTYLHTLFEKAIPQNRGGQ